MLVLPSILLSYFVSNATAQDCNSVKYAYNFLTSEAEKSRLSSSKTMEPLIVVINELVRNSTNCFKIVEGVKSSIKKRPNIEQQSSEVASEMAKVMAEYYKYQVAAAERHRRQSELYQIVSSLAQGN